MMSRIAAEINLTSEGISRVLLVTDGRFTEEEKSIYNFLKDTILNDDLVTIVRTKFPNFRIKEECDVDKRIMSEENEIIRCGDVIHVDNPPTNITDDDNANVINIRTRNRSREILLDHVEEVCKNDNIFNKMIARIMKMIEKTR
ncbi:unnamed protein product [Rhizophagus irregularis]|nr:unnamed protein product [Rhizophagus irregularis]